MSQSLQIGVVAQRTGLSVDAIRFYEKQRLVKPASRSEGGFRLFRAEDVETLQLIRSAQGLGFSLDEIRELLALRNGVAEPCSQVEQLVERKLKSVQQKMLALKTLETQLCEALGRCREALGRSRSQQEAGCPVLEQIGRRPHAVRRK